MSEQHEWNMEDLYERERAEGRTNLSRRDFIKYAGVTTAGLAALGAVGCSPEAEKASGEKIVGQADPFEGAETYYAACSPECQHHNLCAYVKDGKIVKVGIGRNNESLPCMRGLSRLDWLNTDARLTKPLLRDGEKGEGKWKEIGWDEALDLMQQKIQETIDTVGNKGLVFESHAGNFHNITGQLGSAFTSRIGGCTSLTGTLCCAGTNGAVIPMWGKRYFDTRNTIAESDCIIVWGNNPAVTQGGYFYRYEQMMEKGGKLIVIDPVYSETAAKATEWIPIRPTTDGALALGMLRIIVDEGLIDQDFLLAHTTAPCLVGADGAMVLMDPADPLSYAVLDSTSNQLARHDASGVKAALTVKGTSFESQYTTVYDLTYDQAAQWTPEAVEAETGVPAETVKRIAEEYAKADKAMIIQNMGGFMRNYYGTDAVATQLNLAIFTGNVGQRGTGVCDAGGINNLVKLTPAFENPEVPKDLPTIPRVKFAEHVLADDPNPIQVFVSYRVSPMTQYPNTGLLKEALKKIPFVVVIDSLMTSTALYADLVLPDAAVFETEDVLCNARSHLLHLSEKAIEPPGEAKEDLWIFTELARRFGVGEDFEHDMPYFIKKALDGSGYTYDQLKQEKAIDCMPDDFVPYGDGIFYTKSQKAELYQAAWLKKDHPGVPTYIRCAETPNGTSGLGARYPLQATQRKLRRSVHSTFSTLALIQNVDGDEPHVMISVGDAKKRNIADGDACIVYNDRGEHKAVAIVTDNIMDGVVCLENGWGESQGGSSSYVTNDAVGLLAGEHCCCETLVEVRKGA